MTLDTKIQLRPQPVGIFAPPAGYLLLSAQDDNKALLHGDATSAPEFYRAAIAGDLERAASLVMGDDAIAEWNRFLLVPDEARLARLKSQLPEQMQPLLAAVLYTMGLSEARPDAAALDGELRALVLLSTAAWHLEREDDAAALAELKEALELTRPASPLLAAQVLHQMAAMEREQNPAQALAHYREAIRLAGDTPLIELRAELWINLGTTLQESADGRRGVLLEAAKAYQEAIRCGLSLDVHPALYAFAQMNLALAYLTIPRGEASDQLRMGIAVQGLREALKVFTRETHQEMWATAQLNLANALQYLPSAHPEENLQQAVALYEDLMQVRSQARDPLGYARLLANQANALAHLGVFQPAIEKFNEAHKLFHWHNEPQMAASVLEMVATVNLRMDARAAEKAEV